MCIFHSISINCRLIEVIVGSEIIVFSVVFLYDKLRTFIGCLWNVE